MSKLYTVLFEILLRIFRIKPLIAFFKKHKALLIVFLGVCALLLLEWFKTFNLTELMEYKKSLLALSERRPLLLSVSFFLIYFFIATLSIPGTTVLNLIGGFLFGFIKGTLISVFAVSLGACGTFLLIRYFLRDFFLKKEIKKLKKIYNILEKDSLYYLFALRMFPLTPFFFTNIVMGLSSIKLSVFYMVSFISLLPGLAIYANIGSQFSYLEDLQDFVAPNLLLSFSLIGIFPLFVKYLFRFLKKFKKSKEDLPLESDNLLFG